MILMKIMMTKILTKKKKTNKRTYKLYKDGNEVIINETQLDNFLDLGWKQTKEEKPNQLKSSFKQKQIKDKE